MAFEKAKKYLSTVFREVSQNFEQDGVQATLKTRNYVLASSYEYEATKTVNGNPVKITGKGFSVLSNNADKGKKQVEDLLKHG